MPLNLIIYLSYACEKMNTHSCDSEFERPRILGRDIEK